MTGYLTKLDRQDTKPQSKLYNVGVQNEFVSSFENLSPSTENLVRKALNISAARDDLTVMDESLCTLYDEVGDDDETLMPADEILTRCDEALVSDGEAFIIADEILSRAE